MTQPTHAPPREADGWRHLTVILAALAVALAAWLAAAAHGAPVTGDPHAGHDHSQHAAAAPSAGGGWLDVFKIYVPRRQCMFEEQDVIWAHLIGDGIITAAYFSIPFALVTLVRHRRDLAFHWMFGMFAAFILLCGITHLFGIIAIWSPPYRLDGYVKLLTGAVSAVTAIALWPLIPRIIQLPSPRMLAEANARLEAANVQLGAANAELTDMRGRLEERVAGRTADLEQANARLRREVEAREQAQAAERSAREEAERLNRVKDEFLSTLSHELRTPLNAIMGWAQILRAQLPAPGEASEGPLDVDELVEGVGTIERNARVQSQIVNDLLDMSRIISGKLRLEPRATDVREVIEAAVETVRPAAEGRHVALSLDVPQDDALWASVDPDRLQQVAWNLLTNAVKFTPAGGRVDARVARDGGEIVVSVADTGQGIEAAFLPHVFEPFRQADGSASRHHGGLGLGLSIVRRLVEMHGGTATATSDGLGHGATFTVRLPAGRPPAETGGGGGRGRSAAWTCWSSPTSPTPGGSCRCSWAGPAPASTRPATPRARSICSPRPTRARRCCWPTSACPAPRATSSSARCGRGSWPTASTRCRPRP